MEGFELKRKIEEVYEPLLKAALAHVPEDDGDSYEFFRHALAPEHMFLPAIMTDCDPSERDHLVKHHKMYVRDGKWIGAFNNNKRAVMSLTTKKSKADGKQGKKKEIARNTKKGSFKKQAPTVTVYVAQVVLLADDRFPREDEEASHLCHYASCIRAEHLIWERGDFNRRRKRCHRAGECVCRLEPPCMIGAHTK
jgi:hypothetical protein